MKVSSEFADLFRVDDAEAPSLNDDKLIARISGDTLAADFLSESRARDEAFRKAQIAAHLKNLPAPGWGWNDSLGKSRVESKTTGTTLAKRHESRLQQITEKLQKLFAPDSEELAEGISLAKRLLGGAAAETLAADLLEEEQ